MATVLNLLKKAPVGAERSIWAYAALPGGIYMGFFSTNHVAKAVQLMPCQVRFRSRKFCIQLQHSFHLLGMLRTFVAEYQKVRGTA